MTRDELSDQYFDWMYQLVVDDRYSNKSYRKLFARLYDTEFTYTIPMDGNRAEDGINLRYRFGCEQLYSDVMVASCLDDRPCSILEMMIALSIRCEEHIMDDPDVGDRTGQWFVEHAGEPGAWRHGRPEVRPIFGRRHAWNGFCGRGTNAMERAAFSRSTTAVICGARRSGIR